MTPAEQVSRRLEALPDLRRTFDAATERLARRDGLGVAVSGSLAGGAAAGTPGTIDRWSDLDLELFVGPEASVRDTVEWARRIHRSRRGSGRSGSPGCARSTRPR